MWLLDHNLPVQINAFLNYRGIPNSTTAAHGWQNLRNGELVAAARAKGYTCILTRDVEFGNEARKALDTHKDMAVVLLVLPQKRGALYLEAFVKHWDVVPIKPEPGKMIQWPQDGEK